MNPLEENFANNTHKESSLVLKFLVGITTYRIRNCYTSKVDRAHHTN